MLPTLATHARGPVSREDAAHAAARFATLGTPENDDRPLLERLLAGVHRFAKYSFFNVRCLGATSEAVARDMLLRPEDVDRILRRADRALVVLGHDPDKLAKDEADRFPADARAVMLEHVGTRPPPRQRRRRRANPG